MDIRSLIKKMLMQYIIIYAGSMFGTLVFCSIFYPSDLFGLDYFVWMLLFSLLGDLPLLVFYSAKELTEKQWITRQIIHFLLLEAVLLSAAYKTGMFEGVIEGTAFVFVILAVYVLVRLITFRNDIRLAQKMNFRLQERKNKRVNGK
ncbi:MAG: DUF3021 domain-containing protein [Clostridiales bacterium]|nr:DUF3021 domain-containing protein [Clostridiales bacterium]